MSEEKVPAPKRPIIKGRMPPAIVFLVRYGQNAEKGVSEKAQLFATTVGKINDIVKGNNFAYVTESFAPSDAQVEDGVAWLMQHPEGAPEDLIAELEGLPRATDQQILDFEAARKSARKVSDTPRKPRKRKDESAEVAEDYTEVTDDSDVTSDDLLA